MTIRRSGRRARLRVSALRKTASLVLASLLLSLVGVMSTTGTASASTTLCSGFTACTTSPYTAHGYDSHNTTSYWGQTANTGHNCTNYVAYYEQAVNGMSSSRPSWLSTQYNADGWATEAAGAGITVSSTPVVGAVAQWGDYGWNKDAGHVAIVESVSSDGKTIEISEDSYSSGPYEWVSFSSTEANSSTTQGWPDHFIYLGGVTSAPTYTHASIAWDQGGTLYQLSGQTSGAFSVAGSTTGIGSATWVAGGYFRANGKPQVVSYSASTGTLTEFEWTGSSWAWVNNTTGLGKPDWAVAGNFSGNGHDGIAWDQGGTLYYLSGQSDGTFSFGGSTAGIGPATWVGAGGFRDDGKAQVASYSSATGTITEFEWTGSSWAWVNNTTGIGNPDWAVTGDFNNTGHSDIGWDQGGTLYQLSGQSDGTFSFGGSTAGIGPATWVGAGDFRADGKAEIVSYSATTGTITEFESTGSSFAWVNNTTGIGVPDWAATNGSDR